MSTNPTNFGQTLEQRLLPSVARDQQFADILRQSIRVALPAIVQSFDPGPPATASVLVASNELAQFNIDQSQAQLSAQQVSIQTKAVQLPILVDVPVMMLGAGPWSITCPIQRGDECLIVFADTPIDVWFQNGGLNASPVSQRRHDLSDGLAIFGLRSTPRGLSGWSSGSMQIRNDDSSVVIDLASNQITITAPNVQVNCSGTAAVQAETVNVEGSNQVSITSSNQVTISGSGHTSIESKDFLAHHHSGVQAGGGTTGPVV
jgi:hypothetical protein